jgi:hypothetical protein
MNFMSLTAPKYFNFEEFFKKFSLHHQNCLSILCFG